MVQPRGKNSQPDLFFENLTDEKILTINELAQRLRVSVSGLRKLLARQQLSGAFKVGQQWRFRWPLVVQALSIQKETVSWHD